MRKKKDLPLAVLKSLEPFVNLRGDVFEVVEPNDTLLKVIDVDPDSKFHFTLEKYQKDNNGNFAFLMSRIPYSINDNGVFQTWVNTSAIAPQFDAWINLLKEYETVNSFFDDPIIKSFKEEFYAEFEVIDEDADINPLKTTQILILDRYLEYVDSKLLEFITEQNSTELEEIRADVFFLRKNITTKSKKWVVSKLSNICAKIAKQGTIYIKEFLTESKKELIKQGVKGLIDFVKDNGTELLS